MGLFGAAAFTMGSVCFFHLSHVGLKTPHIRVANYGEGDQGSSSIPLREVRPGVFSGMRINGGLSVSGTDIKAPLERFEKAFNAQVDEQDRERSKDYLYAGIADLAGAFAALVSVIIEASATDKNAKRDKGNEPHEPGDDGRGEWEAQDGQRCPDKKTNAAQKNDDPIH